MPLKSLSNKRKLYIIGNGFDRGHGLLCNYHDFYKYLKENREDILEVMEKFYDVREKSQLWTDFESNLEKDIDYDEFTKQIFEHAPNIASDEFRDRDWYQAQFAIEIESEELIELLQEGFEEWIQSLNVSSTNKSYSLNTSAYFLTFNYTEVLESVYDIPPSNILHIHNKVGEDLIFGHGKNVEDFNVRKALYGTENPFLSYDENGNIESTENGHERFAEEAVCSFYDKMKKQTEKIIQRHSCFFEKLSDISEVIVLGHSYNEIDEPYFKQIASAIPNTTKWTLCYYTDDDKIKAKKLMQKLNVAQNLQEYKHSDDLKIKNNNE